VPVSACPLYKRSQAKLPRAETNDARYSQAVSTQIALMTARTSGNFTAEDNPPTLRFCNLIQDETRPNFDVSA
jgi:hypothetical protein